MSYLKAKKVNYPSIHKITSFRELKGIEWFDLVRCLISNEPNITKTPLSKSIRELSLDIQKNGLTHPILILNDEVVYGMQRSVIAKHLNYTHISCYYCKDKEQLDKIHKEQCAQKKGRFFPFDLFDMGPLPGGAGQIIKRLEQYSLMPPYPWGQWIYAQQLLKICTQVRGDAIELGVASGGTSLLLGHLLKSHGRKVFSLDSFEGLPPPISRDNPYFLAGDYGDYEGYEPLLERFCGLIEQEGLTNVVIPIKGFFADTVPKLEQPKHLCFAHLDSDLYDSVYCSLEGVYDRMSPGGILIIDDFFHHAQGPARACSVFFNKAQIQPLYHVVFPYAVGIIKGEKPARNRRRSLDGNIYTFDWMSDDPVFRESLELSLDRTVLDSGTQKQAQLLIDVLDDKSSNSANIYRYWVALEEFWDSISSPRSRDWKIKI